MDAGVDDGLHILRTHLVETRFGGSFLFLGSPGTRSLPQVGEGEERVLASNHRIVLNKLLRALLLHPSRALADASVHQLPGNRVLVPNLAASDAGAARLLVAFRFGTIMGEEVGEFCECMATNQERKE